MAATLSLDTITSSGSTITVPTGKTIAITDAGNLTIGGVAITTGAQGVISKTATYTILAGDFTGKSSLIVFVNASSGTSTETVITLPAEDAFGTCAMHVISTHAHGAGNFITIKNDTPTEVYTLYGIGDHCEFVSDGTTAFRTGNEHVTAQGFVFRTSNDNVAGGATEALFPTSGFTVREDIGSWWNSTTVAAEIPWDCRILVETLVFNRDWNQYLSPSIKRYSSSRASNEWILRTDNKTSNSTGNGPMWTFEYDFGAGDEIEYNIYNLHATSTAEAAGDATNGWRQGCYAKWTVVRRY